jgi:type IV secretion system protein VirB2
MKRENGARTPGRSAIAASAALLAPLQAAAQAPINDPQGSGPILAAVNWLQGSLLGNVATTAAVIAVAAVGFMMLTGRLNWRYGITVIVGCFILFGATSIVAGIRAAAGG